MDACSYLDRDSWKVPIRTQLQQTVWLVSSALFLLMVSVVTHSVTKQKFFAVIMKLIALGTGMAGGNLFMSFKYLLVFLKCIFFSFLLFGESFYFHLSINHMSKTLSFP